MSIFSAQPAKMRASRGVALLVSASLALFGATFIQAEPAQAVNPDCVSTTSTYMNGAVEWTVRTFSTGAAACDWRVPSVTTEVNVLLVGAGGGGGGGASTVGGRGGGGGGAGGEVHELILRPSGGEIMTIAVGDGGVRGNGGANTAGALALCGGVGGDTSVSIPILGNTESYTVEGGHGGSAGGVGLDCVTEDTSRGGNGGWMGAYNGGVASGKQGGSGASSAGHGVDGTDATNARAARAGLTSSITGTSTEYGQGGGGSYIDVWGAEPTNFGSGGQGGRGSLNSGVLYHYGYAGSVGIDGAVILSYVTPTSAGISFVTVPNGSAAATTTPVALNGSTTITATPNAGYRFSSWSCTGGTLSSTTTNPATLSAITADAFCTPTFIVYAPALTVVNTPGVAWIASPSVTTYGGSFTMSANMAPGYTFTGWSCTNGTLSSSSALSVTLSNVTVDPTCTPGATAQTVTVTFASLTNGTAAVTTSPVNYNGSVSLTATPDSGYLFTGWSCTAGTLSSTTANPATLSGITANAVCTATFVLPDSTPTPVIGGITPSSGPIAGGTTITINGTDFDSPTVTIGGQTCVIVTSSATQITCVVPAGSAGSADIVVDNGGGHTDTASGGFTYVVPATVLDIPKRPTPSQAKVTLGGGSLKVEMTYGGTAEFKPSGYTAYVKPGGNSCVIPQGATTCEILGLKPGVEYTLVITAVNAAGISPSLTMPDTYLIGEKSPLKLFAKLGIRPFAGNSAVMTKAFRAQIRKFVAANPKLTAFTCTGYTAGKPVVKSDRTLAKARASAVCGYIQKLRPTAAVTVIGLTPGLSWSANNRKVLVQGYGLED